MNDRNRDQKLERLFYETRDALPGLEPDPDLPAHIRALAAARATRGDGRARAPRRWTLVSLAGAAFAISILTGGYIGYWIWASSPDAATEQISDAEAITAAVSQSGFADELADNSEVWQ